MTALQIGALFAGYGGLEMATQSVLGGTVAWHSEIDPGACQVLAHHHPDVPNLGDITAINWDAVLPIDILVGGWPCQDISPAGPRGGIEGARSGLWRYLADAVRVLQPRLVVLENVSAVLVRGLDRVAADLAALGYDLHWTCLRASDVGAPHPRDRWFGVAVQNTDRAARSQWRIAAPGQTQSRRTRADAGRRGGAPDSVAWGQFEPAIRRWERILGRPAPEPTVDGRRTNRILSPMFVEWMMGLPAGHVTDVPDLTRNQQLHLLGNGVCPQQASAALRWLLTTAADRQSADTLGDAA